VGRETHREREELGGPAGERSADPAEERMSRRDVDEPLEPPEEPREESRDDVPMEQTFTIIRVRRVTL
jgi:hypothetical protein